MGQHYTENFVQCTLSAMDKLAGSTLVVGGDGRYYGKEATEKIIRMCAANKVHFVCCCAQVAQMTVDLHVTVTNIGCCSYQ